MKGYTDEHYERDRKIRNDGRMQDEAQTAARIRMEIHEAQKAEKHREGEGTAEILSVITDGEEVTTRFAAPREYYEDEVDEVLQAKNSTPNKEN